MGEDNLENIKTKTQFLSLNDAIQKIKSSSTIMMGGFGTTGTPEYLLEEMHSGSNINNLTIINNNINEQSNIYKLFKNNRIKKVIGTYFTTSRSVVKAYREGKIEIELVPQGTFAEAIRLGGSGIPAFYTPTSVGTELSKNKEIRTFDSKEYVLEKSLTADVALIKAYKADKAGNLIFRKSTRNFNPAMAMAATLTIVEVEEIVEIGELDPESIVTPFIYVDIVVDRREKHDK